MVMTQSKLFQVMSVQRSTYMRYCQGEVKRILLKFFFVHGGLRLSRGKTRVTFTV